MYSPEFLNQLQSYLRAQPGVPFQTWLSGGQSPAPMAPAPMAPAPMAPAPMATPTVATTTVMEKLRGPQGHKPRGIKDIDTLRGKGKKDTPTPTPTPTPTTAPAMASGISFPPAGYRYGVDPEWNYGFKAMTKYEKPVEDKKYAGGPVTYMAGGGGADSGIAASRVVVSRPDSGGSNAVPVARPTSTGTKVNLAALSSMANNSGGSSRSRTAAKAEAPKEYSGFWDRINGAGPGAGYKNLFDMVNGGGMNGSYANPGTNIRGLGAVVYDLQNGGISALARDMVNGGGLGASGDKFRGGQYGLLANMAGIRPAGDKKSIFNAIPEASPELEKRWEETGLAALKNRKRRFGDRGESKFNINNLFGTEATKPTGAYAGGVVRFAEGGITDIPMEDAPMQPPEGNEKDLISGAIAAIKGQVEDPRPVLGAFLAKYGEEALRNLVDKVESGDVDKTAARSEGMLRGPGDGMDDRIPAKAEGGHDVLLANSEYIVPADVISALGNGSSDAGAEKMDKMLERVRIAAHGKATQQKKVSADKVLPA